jgi:hypothetical protein
MVYQRRPQALLGVPDQPGRFRVPPGLAARDAQVSRGGDRCPGEQPVMMVTR